LTPLGWAATAAGAVLTALGVAARWAPVAVLGVGMLVLVAGSAAYVLRRPAVSLERAVEPPRVQKGLPAISLISATNRSRRPVGALAIVQRMGDREIPARLERLRPGETTTRAYRLPTSERGTFEVGPVELPRADPFGLCRTVQHLGRPQVISVHPRLLPLRPLPTGISRNLEGPSNDSSPAGSITFHRLREYVVGDDLRLVHWPSTARLGTLVVRHNVDTAQPYTVVVLDLHPDGYSADTFEEAVDVAASVSIALSAGRAPVQLRTTAGDRLGGPAWRDPAALVDHLTAVQPDPSGSLDSELVKLRRERGGSALVIVTGWLEPASLPTAAALRRRFDRVIVLSVARLSGRLPAHPGLVCVGAATAGEMAQRWNVSVAR
jgi:uncharacterized protein (DUF58 family)